MGRPWRCQIAGVPIRFRFTSGRYPFRLAAGTLQALPVRWLRRRKVVQASQRDASRRTVVMLRTVAGARSAFSM
jgi:hypothetical protein